MNKTLISEQKEAHVAVLLFRQYSVVSLILFIEVYQLLNKKGLHTAIVMTKVFVLNVVCRKHYNYFPSSSSKVASSKTIPKPLSYSPLKIKIYNTSEH